MVLEEHDPADAIDEDDAEDEGEHTSDDSFDDDDDEDADVDFAIDEALDTLRKHDAELDDSMRSLRDSHHKARRAKEKLKFNN